MTASFEEWLTRYMAWRKSTLDFTEKPIPTELSELHREQQELSPLYSKAEGFKSDAEFYSRQAIETKQAKRARIIWAEADAAGRCRVLVDRSIKVAQAIKMQDGQAGKW